MRKRLASIDDAFRAANDACFEAEGRELPMCVKEIWRYPVKSMAGRSLRPARLTALGVEDDRIVQVRNARERPIKARTCPGFAGIQGLPGRLRKSSGGWGSMG